MAVCISCLGRIRRVASDGALNKASIGGIFAAYPEWRGIEPVAAEANAGDGVFFSAMVAHAAGPNMTIHPRRAVALVYIPQGAVYNGTPHVLPEAALGWPRVTCSRTTNICRLYRT